MLANDIQAKLVADGWTIDSKLLKDDFDGIEGTHTFEVTIRKGRQEYTTQYSAGCAHRSHPNGVPIDLHAKLTTDELISRKRTKPNKPTLTDFLACLVCDASCVAYGESFEDFCANLGYDTDSRKAEKAYHECLYTLQFLKRTSSFEELLELFQDY